MMVEVDVSAQFCHRLLSRIKRFSPLPHDQSFGEYSWIFPSFSWGIFGRVTFRPIAREQKDLMDYNP